MLQCPNCECAHAVGPISLLPRMLEAATQVSEPGSHRRHGQALVGALLNALGGSFLRANLPGPALCSIAPLLRAPHHEAIQAGLQLLLAVVQEAPQAAADALPELEGLLSTVWGLMPRVSDHCAVRYRSLHSMLVSHAMDSTLGPHAHSPSQSASSEALVNDLLRLHMCRQRVGRGGAVEGRP